MEWTRGRTIGRGTSATVSVAASRLSGHVFAVKSTELARSESLRREQKILSTLNSPHIVGYKGCDICLENGKPMFNLMMEYAPDGTIAEAIRRRGRLEESTIADYMRQILRGLEYLRSRGIVHCDIKGSNILLTEDGVKIADFGCSKAADEAVIGGTPLFMAPEVVRGEEQRFPADIWALGCTVVEMSTGKSPWPNATSTLHRIAFSGEPPEIPAFLSDLAKDFLDKCLRVDPKERWTAEKLLKHPFLEEFRFLDGKLDQEQFLIMDRTGSPTSILDQCIWSSVDEENSRTSNDMDYTDFLDCPKKRIEQLASGLGKWGRDEDWMTVRDSEKLDNDIFFDVCFSLNSKDRCTEKNSWGPNFKSHIEELELDQFQFL